MRELCPAGAEQGSTSHEILAGMPMFQAEKKLADTQMHSLIAIMTTSKPMGVPEGINTKIHTSRDFGSRGRRVTLPRKKGTGKATLAIRIWLPQKKNH